MVDFVFLMEKIQYLQICLDKVFVGSCFIVRKVCLYKLIMQYMFIVLHYNTLYYSTLEYNALQYTTLH